MIRRFQQLGQARGVHIQRGQGFGIIAQRMAGNVKPGHVFFKAEHRAEVVFGDVGQRGLHLFEQTVAEEGHLPDHVAAAALRRAIQRAFIHGHELGAPRAGAIHCAGENQRFDDALVDLLGIHSLAEIEDVLIRAALAPLGDNGINRLVAAGFDRAEAETDTARALRVPADGELAHTLVDIRREKRNSVLAAILRIRRDLSAVGRDGVEQGGEELHRVMALEPAGAHGDNAVSRRVGFVEGIGSEGCHLVEKLAGDFGAHAVAHTARHDDLSVLLQTVDEDFALLGHDVVLLFRHGAPHEVASTI